MNVYKLLIILFFLLITGCFIFNISGLLGDLSYRKTGFQRKTINL